MDLGSGALGALHRYVDPLAIDAVLLSHLHADHCLDLCGFYVHAQVPPGRPAAAAPGLRARATPRGRMARAYDLPDDPGMAHEFDFRTLDAGHRCDHRAVHRRGDPGRAPGRGLRPAGHRGRSPRRLHRRHRRRATSSCRLAAGADLLLAEASFRDEADNPPDIHLTGTDCGEVARDAGVGRLVITHVPPWYDKQDDARRGPDGLGRPGRAGPPGRDVRLY